MSPVLLRACETHLAAEKDQGFVDHMGTEVRGGFAQRMAEFRDKVGKRPVYLCFDMDVFDPSVAPGVCTPTWGGLSAREGIDLLRCLSDLNIVAVDVNTVSPPPVSYTHLTLPTIYSV